MGQMPPLTAGSHQIQNGVEDFAPRAFPRSAHHAGFSVGKKAAQQVPFDVGQVTWIRFSGLHSKLFHAKPAVYLISVPYAEHLRHFAAGIITFDDYRELAEDLFFYTDDRAVVVIYYSVSIPYAVFRRMKVHGKLRLTDKARKTAARCVLFLQSDREYERPKMSAQGCLLNIVTLGSWNNHIEARLINESECWPFYLVMI